MYINHVTSVHKLYVLHQYIQGLPCLVLTLPAHLFYPVFDFMQENEVVETCEVVTDGKLEVLVNKSASLNVETHFRPLNKEL